jgi:pSer/pThr/pTyr-binding forkhead associated (FHA) protein
MAAAQQAAHHKLDIKIRLTVVKGPHSGQVFQINKAALTLGRGPENDVVLMNDSQVSRSHAKIYYADRDLEIKNLSSKNSILVQGQNVQQWKIVNKSTFTIGETEIQVEYDLGKATLVGGPVPQKANNVVPMKQGPPKPAIAGPPKRAAPVGKVPVPRNGAVAPRGPIMPQQMRMPQYPPAMAPTAAPAAMPHAQMPGPTMGKLDQKSIFANPKFRIYALIAVIAIVGYVFSSTGKKGPAKIESTLKYEDEIDAKLNSQKAKDLEAAREELRKQKNSSMKLKVEENFIRGMRDFQLGNYARAEEAFDAVLGIDPDHALARRHKHLSKVRFDEIVQEKLMLGESNFKKHNFKICESFYRQVMDMLQGRNNDQKLQLAEKKARECELASEGIR